MVTCTTNSPFYTSHHYLINIIYNMEQCSSRCFHHWCWNKPVLLCLQISLTNSAEQHKSEVIHCDLSNTWKQYISLSSLMYCPLLLHTSRTPHVGVSSVSHISITSTVITTDDCLHVIYSICKHIKACKANI